MEDSVRVQGVLQGFLIRTFRGLVCLVCWTSGLSAFRFGAYVALGGLVFACMALFWFLRLTVEGRVQTTPSTSYIHDALSSFGLRQL